MNYGNNGYRLNLICLSIDSCNSSKLRRSMCIKSMPLFHLLCNGTNMSSLLTKRAGNCQHRSLNNATSRRGFKAATHPAASANEDAANLTVPRAVRTENWCGRSASPVILLAS